MAENTYYALIHYQGTIETNNRGSVVLKSPSTVGVIIHETITFVELHSLLLEELKVQNNKKIGRLFYRVTVTIGVGKLEYGCQELRDDADVRKMFFSHSIFPEVRVIEFFVELEDVVSSQGSVPIATRASPSVAPANVAGDDRDSDEEAYNDTADITGDEYIDLNNNVSFADLALQIAQPVNVVPCPVGNIIQFQHRDDDGEDADAVRGGGDHVLQAEDVLLHQESDEEVAAEPEVAAQCQPQTSQERTRPMHQSRTAALMCGVPQHYSTLNLEAEGPHSSAQVSVQSGNSEGETEFFVGQSFPDKESVVYAVKNYSIRRRVQLKVRESSQIRYHGRCVKFGDDCNWSICVSYRHKKGTWEVRKYDGPHTCVFESVLQAYPQLDSSMICYCIFPMVKNDPNVPVRVLQGAVESTFNFKISYKKAWLAKQKAIGKIYGDWEESYNELPRWLFGVQEFMPGTIFSVQTKPYYVGDLVDRSCVMFHRVFWTFPSCIEAFKWCKPFISIDGTHLYGKYHRVLLMAIAQDENSNILPVAFALVEGETREAWSFFLYLLRQHVTPQEGILVISDRHGSIKSALNAEGSGWQPPRAYYAYCIRHIVANFALQFKSKDAKRTLTNAAYAKSERDFLYYYSQLRDENAAMCTWVDRIPRSMWTQYADEGRRSGHMTPNLSECINAVMKGTRNLPITAIVQATYYRLSRLFAQKGRETQGQIAGGHRWSQHLLRAIRESSQKIGRMTVHGLTRDNVLFMVSEIETGHTYRVNLTNRTCDCGGFQALHYPCSHALAACGEARVQWGSFTHQCYSLEWIFNVYRKEFSAIPDTYFWPQYNGPYIRPDPSLRRASEGRPVLTRIRNGMDETEEGNQPKRCGVCRNSGYTQKTCPTLRASSSAGPA